MSPYVIGIDFGTLSARAVLLNAETGEEAAQAVFHYPHAVMDTQLPGGEKLPPNYALQHPQDYIDALQSTIQTVLHLADLPKEAVRGIGIDFTTCTVLPVDKENQPLCFRKEYDGEKHAYVKLWKHHAAQPEADDINALAKARNESWLKHYGGKISCEWFLPKILEVLREAPHVYADTDRFTEAADWLNRLLTGTESHSASLAGYKALWNEKTGYPSNDFMKALDPRLDGIVGSKISEKICTLDGVAGYVSAEGAARFGLCEGTAVSVPLPDAHAAMPALGLTEAGDVMLIVGTSSCHILNSTVTIDVPGICGYVKDGAIPGLYTYEAGQAGVGDIFDWCVRTCVPAAYEKEAEARGIGIHRLLREKAERQKPGESGLLALDWWSGNRSVLVNSSLKGMILGMDLQTRPEEIYRAMIEATAFGMRIIVEQYESYGIHMNKLCAAGGIAQKDSMMMQIYADVLGTPIEIAGCEQAPAYGSAIYAACAAGIYPSIGLAAKHLAKPPRKRYFPNPEHREPYNRLFAEYARLHDYFGKENNVMLSIGK